jgi:hypothetical protein
VTLTHTRRLVTWDPCNLWENVLAARPPTRTRPERPHRDTRRSQTPVGPSIRRLGSPDNTTRANPSTRHLNTRTRQTRRAHSCRPVARPRWLYVRDGWAASGSATATVRAPHARAAALRRLAAPCVGWLPTPPCSAMRAASARARAAWTCDALATLRLPFGFALARWHPQEVAIAAEHGALHTRQRRERWGFPSDLGGGSLNTCSCVYLRVFACI